MCNVTKAYGHVIRKRLSRGYFRSAGFFFLEFSSRPGYHLATLVKRTSLALVIVLSTRNVLKYKFFTYCFFAFFKVAPPETLGDLALIMSSSPSKNYFFVIFATCLALIFVGGLVFGRLSKRIRKEVKDR